MWSVGAARILCSSNPDLVAALVSGTKIRALVMGSKSSLEAGAMGEVTEEFTANWK
jgi:hypothetical protein